jgi:Carboxypeptidase regulatory-like domain
MAALFSSIVATALVLQLPGPVTQGKVVDDQGKPVAGARVVANTPYSRFFVGRGDPVEVETKSGADGQFHLALPAKLRGAMHEVYVWAYHPGLAIAFARQFDPSGQLILPLIKPRPGTITIQGPGGKPVAGAVLAPRALGRGLAGLPGALSLPLARTTAPDGQLSIDYLTGIYALGIARVSAPTIGTQDVALENFRRPGGPPADVTLRLKPTSNLAGRVRDSAGKPVAGQVVEVWSKGVVYQSPSPVDFLNGPMRTAADGSFRTPDNLLVGSQYLLSIRAPGMEPILSKWITITDQPHVLFPFIQKPLRTISGRVVDRQGKPVANVDVFQSGDGPKPTETRSDANGRFSLGGFPHGPVVLFARVPGYRFFGRLIKPGEDDVTVKLTRRSERPAREMRMLPEPMPLEESRMLAKRLMEPYWNAAAAKKDPSAMYRALQSLAAADPDGVLERLDKEAGNLIPNNVSSIKFSLAWSLARTDPERALRVGETLDLRRTRSPLFMRLAEALPAEKREEKLALMARAADDARAANLQFAVADVAERLDEMNEKAKAKALFAESLKMKPDTPGLRVRFAARLARFDLPAALAIIKEMPRLNPQFVAGTYWSIAFRLAAENPAEAERVLRMAPRASEKHWFAPSIAWRMAQADPSRAQRLADEAHRHLDDPDMFLFLALGLKSREPAAAERAFWKAMDVIDERMKLGLEYSNFFRTFWIVLPLVEQIDPALVPELFWRAVAMRLPTGDPRQAVDLTPAELALLLGRYDRAVAALVFDPCRARMEATDDAELDLWTIAFMSWSIFDPRAAVARLERASAAAGLQNGPSHSSEAIAELLGLSLEDRWRKIWSTYTDMRYLLERDIP